MTAQGDDPPAHEARLRDRAEEYAVAADASLVAGRFNVAYEEARTAAELGAKVILLRATGSYPKAHNVAGELHQRRLTPKGIASGDLSLFLGDASRGGYGFDQPVDEEEATRAVAMARRLLAQL